MDVGVGFGFLGFGGWVVGLRGEKMTCTSRRVTDLHVADVLPRPQRLEHQVGEAQHGQVLDQLLAQVVVCLGFGGVVLWGCLGGCLMMMGF